ncbi:MAG: hypothetical protein LW832_09990 [Parachlamydia sp.]|jgi:hypothetical protein|nr:hypothetical protein [Parachlamydia sp.]
MKIILNLVAISMPFFSFTSELVPVIDASSEACGLPKNWRNTKQKIEEINLDGFADLQISGSAQFHEKSFESMVSELADFSLIILDMREETHFFVNGLSVSWTDGPLNGGNKGMSLKQIIEDERLRMKSLVEEGIINTKPPLQAERMQTEKELVESLGHRYIRLPITDRSRPSDAIVDRCITIIQSMQTDEWIHVHCKAGKGRTTTFMTLYDMIKNSQQVSFEDILARQKGIGGSDFYALKNSEAEELKKERLDFLEQFYLYCQEVPGFEISWSEWVSKAPVQ